MYTLKRDSYLNKIKPLIDKDIIKVLTGIRRCGKSVMLKLIMEELENKGILKSNIIYLNFDSSKFQNIKLMKN